MIIKGNSVGCVRSNWNQNDPSQADFIVGKEAVDSAIVEAKENAEQAKSTASRKADLLALSITLSAGGWANNLQTVDAAGVTADKERCHVIPCTPDSANNELYYNNGLCCEDQLDGKVTFSCKEVPASDVTVNLLVLIKGVTA
jgi:hypothetical protein